MDVALAQSLVLDINVVSAKTLTIVKSVKTEETMNIHLLRLLVQKMFQVLLLLLLMRNNHKYFLLTNNRNILAKDQIVTGEISSEEVTIIEALEEVAVKEVKDFTIEEEDIHGVTWLNNSWIWHSNMLVPKVKNPKKEKQMKDMGVNGNKENGEKKELKLLRFLKMLLKEIQVLMYFVKLKSRMILNGLGKEDASSDYLIEKQNHLLFLKKYQLILMLEV